MPDVIAEKAFEAFKSATLLLTTHNHNKIFQLTHQAILYSKFVTRVVNTQPNELPNKIDWHLSNKANQFSKYLSKEIDNKLLKGSQSFLQGNELDITDFNSEFQNELEIMRFLRVTRYQHACALAILELNNQINIEDAIERMSILAEILIKLAYCWSFSQIKSRAGSPVYEVNLNGQASELSTQNMLILAMGKLGGFELNFSSDIDLIFFYGEDGETKGMQRSIENSHFFQKLGILLIKLLDYITQDGFVFRTDMRLRPYGESGALAISLAQAEDYYQEQGRDWERYAMVRARVISGSVTERECLERIIRPFAFRRYIDYGVIDSLRNMKQMIQREVRRRELKNNIKLGAGGIREIEFMVQSLQLIQGGRNKKLQEKSILKVIPLLVEDNLLDKNIAQDLVTNYRFLRRLENCIQEFEEKQTQELPIDLTQQAHLAEIMGFEIYDELSLKIEQYLLNTSHHFRELFRGNLEEEKVGDDFYLSVWEGLINSQQLLTHAETNLDSNEFIQHIKDFRNSKNRINLSAKGSKRLTAIMPNVIELCLISSSPLNSIVRVIDILKSILKRTAYLDLFVENKPILKHLIDLVSQSEWIALRLSAFPILMDELLYPKSLYQPLKSQDLDSELRQYLLRIEDNDEEALLNCIRQFKQINELRVAAALISGQLNISQVSEYLTQLAEVIIKTSIHQCWQIISSQHGIPENLSSADDYGFAIIGYGKLGGCELGFSSDLDLVFLFDQDLNSNTNGRKPIGATRFYTRLSQKLIHYLSTRTNQGVLYEVDMRLRPSGNSGMLVSHIDTFRSYQKEEAWTWEHQALIRARCVYSGNNNLFTEFSKVRSKIINTKRIRKSLAENVLNMRSKMRLQLDKSTKERFDLKQGVGGLVDVEFLTQFYALHNNSGQFKTVPTNTIRLIKYLKNEGKITEENKIILTDAYNNFRNIINRRVLNKQNSLVDYKQTSNYDILNHQKLVENIWLSEFSDFSSVY